MKTRFAYQCCAAIAALAMGTGILAIGMTKAEDRLPPSEYEQDVVQRFMNTAVTNPQSALPSHKAPCPVCPGRTANGAPVTGKPRPLERPSDNLLMRVVGELPTIPDHDSPSQLPTFHWAGAGRVLLMTSTPSKEVVQREARWERDHNKMHVITDPEPLSAWNSLCEEVTGDLGWLLAMFPTPTPRSQESGRYRCHRISDKRWLVVRENCTPSADCLDYFDLRCNESGEVLLVQRVWFTGVGDHRLPARAIFWVN